MAGSPWSPGIDDDDFHADSEEVRDYSFMLLLVSFFTLSVSTCLHYKCLYFGVSSSCNWCSSAKGATLFPPLTEGFSSSAGKSSRVLTTMKLPMPPMRMMKQT